MDATWPAANYETVEHWTLRDGQGGGKRVSATTGSNAGNIAIAEEEMSALDQPHLFMIKDGDSELDQVLAGRGYAVVDPVTLYCGPVKPLANHPVPRLAGFALWPRLAIMDEIWAQGGIGPSRLAVMDRVTTPKTAILARANSRAAGTAFVAIHRGIAMIHAIEVLPNQRRQGVAINMMRVAAGWAQDQGAHYISLMVTDANAPATALYRKLGLSVVGHYHYRMRQNQNTTEAKRDH
ncbi:MAG: GNAT family N-acetyltransferase [Paracoccaceae bacterium]